MTEDLEQTTSNGPDPYEPTAVGAPASTVLPPAAAARGSRGRWAIAVAVVAVVAVATAFAISLFTGKSPNATVLGYVPGDSIMYGEVRMDLPGDQRAALGQFLSKFPGFADQSAIEGKVDEILDRLVGNATDGDQAFSSDIKPWFGGQVAFSVGALPDPGSVSGSDPAALAGGRYLILVSVKDAAAAQAWVDSVIAEHGGATTTESYGGANLTLVSADGGQQAAEAVLDGKVAVIGDVASVKAAVDTKGAGGFGTTPEVKAALDATSGDHVGFMYVALRPLMEWSTQVGGSGVLGAQPSGALLDLLPDWGAFSLRIEGDGLVMEALAEKGAAISVGENRVSPVADHVPSTAIAMAISHDYGAGLLKTLDTYRSEPALKSAIDTLDEAIGVLGGTTAAIGWIGDAGLAVTRTGSGVEGGVVIVPTDRATAERLFTSLRTLVSLGGASMGISVRDEPYAGTTITIVDLGDLASLAALGGVSPEMLGSGLPAGHIELAYAITDQVVVLGSGPGFVKSVLDTTPATSIAGTDRYKALVARVGPGAGIGFADITAIRELVESAMVNADAGERADYETNVKPFLVPFDALITSSSVKDDVYRSRMIVTVK